jgi:pyrroloquinoline quinone biosynthesis protein E
MQVRANELSTEIWSRVFKEAAEAGVLQADLTGGEPLARTDVVDPFVPPVPPAFT